MRINSYKMLPAILLTLATIPSLASAQFDFGQVVEGIARGAAQEGFNRLPVEQIFEGGSRNRGGGRIENHVIREPKFPTVIRDDNTAAIVQGITYAASQILSDTECRSHHTRYCDGRGVDRRPITPVESGSPAERHFARAQVELKNRNYVTALKHADAAADLVRTSWNSRVIAGKSNPVKARLWRWNCA